MLRTSASRGVFTDCTATPAAGAAMVRTGASCGVAMLRTFTDSAVTGCHTGEGVMRGATAAATWRCSTSAAVTRLPGTEPPTVTLTRVVE